MALRLLYLCLCTSLLAATVAVPSPAPSPVPSGDSCYNTVKAVPEECAQTFIKAIFTDNRNGVTRDCCIQLACVKEWTCADVLVRFCLPPEVDECPGSPKRPPSSRPPAIAPAMPAGTANY